MKRRPASYSLHLDYIIRNSYHKRLEHKQGKNSRSKHSGLKSKLHQVTNNFGEVSVSFIHSIKSFLFFCMQFYCIKILLRLTVADILENLLHNQFKFIQFGKNE